MKRKADAGEENLKRKYRILNSADVLWDSMSMYFRKVTHHTLKGTFGVSRIMGVAGSPVILVLVLALLTGLVSDLGAADEFKFALPEFDTEYVRPVSTHPDAEAVVWEYVNSGILFVTLVLASWFILKLRSRKAVYGLMLFSLVYFGFYREGCICPVGSVQNAVLALVDSAYAMPLVLGAVFILPLLFTLFFGRTFCAAVCPLGVAQDLTAVKPAKVPGWLEHTLGLFPYIFLGIAVLLAATGAGFPVCRLDPYVTVFRLSGSIPSLMLSIVFIALGVIIARPYCRFICPYGVLLRFTSLFSKWHCSITPDECVQCRLCEDSCPFGAIRTPSPEQEQEPRHTGIRRLGILFILFPLILGAGALAGYGMYGTLSRTHHVVRVAERVDIELKGEVEKTTLESDAFRSSGMTVQELFSNANAKRDQFRLGSILLGLYCGLVVWGKIFSLSINRTSSDYRPDRMKCVSCARCFSYCPKEHERMKDKKTLEVGNKGNTDE